MKPKITLVEGQPGAAAARRLLEQAGFEVAAVRLGARESVVPRALRASVLTLDLAGRVAKSGGRPLPLTRKEFDLLAALIERRGRVLERAFLLESVWGDMDACRDAHTLEVHISSLRRKLGRPLSSRIVTVPGFGYRFEKEARAP